MRFVAEPPEGWVRVEGVLASLRPSLASLGVPLVCAAKAGKWVAGAEQAVIFAPGWAADLVRDWPNFENSGGRGAVAVRQQDLLRRVVAHASRLPEADQAGVVRGVLTVLSLAGGEAVDSMLEEGA